MRLERRARRPAALDVFRRIDMESDVFTNRSFTRTEQLRYLLRTRQIDDRFHWRTAGQPEAVAPR